VTSSPHTICEIQGIHPDHSPGVLAEGESPKSELNMVFGTEIPEVLRDEWVRNSEGGRKYTLMEPALLPEKRSREALIEGKKERDFVAHRFGAGGIRGPYLTQSIPSEEKRGGFGKRGKERDDGRGESSLVSSGSGGSSLYAEGTPVFKGGDAVAPCEGRRKKEGLIRTTPHPLISNILP